MGFDAPFMNGDDTGVYDDALQCDSGQDEDDGDFGDDDNEMF